MTARDADVQSVGANGPQVAGSAAGSPSVRERTDSMPPGSSGAAFRQWRAASHEAPQKPSRKMKFPLALSKGLRYIRPTLSERTALPSSSGPGRRPLTAKTPVRVRLGVPIDSDNIEIKAALATWRLQKVQGYMVSIVESPWTAKYPTLRSSRSTAYLSGKFYFGISV